MCESGISKGTAILWRNIIPNQNFNCLVQSNVIKPISLPLFTLCWVLGNLREYVREIKKLKNKNKKTDLIFNFFCHDSLNSFFFITYKFNNFKIHKFLSLFNYILFFFIFLLIKSNM